MRKIIIICISLAITAGISAQKQWINHSFEKKMGMPARTNFTGHPKIEECMGTWTLHTLPIPLKSSGKIFYNGAINIGNISVDTVAYSGEKSMRVDVLSLNARYNFYLISALNLKRKKTYKMTFFAKASVENIPFRVDINTYDKEKNRISGLYNGTVIENFFAYSEWTEYEIIFNTSEMRRPVSFVIRPNVNAAGYVAGWNREQDRFTPTTYWFDTFSIKEIK